ncbi:MAG: peptidase and chymotrypsin/Hap [Acidobacteriaceae bacterium]|nr:peptidase and chymotrypsin/Hap [Acidobacteriaceae bacterium]
MHVKIQGSRLAVPLLCVTNDLCSTLLSQFEAFILIVNADTANDADNPTPEGATFAMKRFLTSAAIAFLFFSTWVLAQGSNPNRTAKDSVSDKLQVEPRALEPLRQFNTSLVALTRRVSPAVVQIMVTGYGPSSGNDKNNNNVALIVRQRAIGSGVIVDPDGYIVTNAHVVEGALRIRVTLPQAEGTSPLDIPPIGKRKVLEATLVGAHKDTDLAVIKVDAHNLPVLPLGATRPVYPGELVLAIGSPEALQSSVTMGVVSSVWRQPDPAQPMVYIQTDAPINPGNSGGPLIDLDGYVVGLNTYILTEGGGSEGIGFAIPARIVRFVYDNLRKYGHVHRTEIEAGAQEITPTLAEGLGLSQDWGVIISDVTSDGPGAGAGLKVNDIIYSVDGRQIVGLPGFSAALYLHPPDETLNMEVLRGAKRVSLVIPALQHYDKEDDLAVLVDPKNFIGRLGVFVINFDDKLRAALPDSHVSGVVVAAQSPGLSSYTSSLRAGDIIHSINQMPLESVEQLKSMLTELKPRQAAVLQIERAGKLQYIAFEWGD